MAEKKKKKIKKILIIILIILVLLVIISLFLRPKNKEEEKIETANIEKRDIATSISATGVIKTETTQNVMSKLTGFKIKKVNVKEGDKISVGDVICTFDTSDLEENLATAQNSLNISQAQSNLGIQGATRNLNDAINNKNTQTSTTQSEVDSALNAYNNAKNTLDNEKKNLSSAQTELGSKLTQFQTESANFAVIESHYNELQAKVNNAQNDLTLIKNALEGAEEPEKNQLETKLKTAEEALSSATTELLNYKPTYEQALAKFTPIKNEYESLTSKVTAKQAEIAQLEATANSLKSTYETLKKSLDSAKTASDSTIASMQDALSSSQLSASLNTETQQAQINSIQKQINEGTVKSTVNGTVTSVSVKAGDLYTGTTIAVIEGAETFIVESEIDEYDIADVEEGMKVLIKTDATRDEELEGTVIYTASSATTSSMSAMGASTIPTGGSATYTVKIALDTPNDRLRLGMNARLSIITDSKEDVWSVPSDAIIEREDGTKYIEILKDEKTNSVEQIDITTGIEGSYYVQIISDKIKDGMKVVIPSGNSNHSIEALIELMGADAGL